MGKGFYINKNNKVNAITTTFFTVILIIASNSYASYQEFELFEQGYEYYLSYQPERAAETFRIFLKEFPVSSAKDAAMFWLGKSLIQLKSFREAEKVFFEIKQQFPDSSFILHIDKELETISEAESEFNKTKMEISETAKEKDTLELKLSEAEKEADLDDDYTEIIILELKLSEAEKEAELRERDLAKAVEEKDKLRALLEEEEKKADEIKAIATALEKKEAELKSLHEAAKEKNAFEMKLAEAEKKAEMKEKDLAKAVEERDKLRAQLEEEKKNTEEMKASAAKLEEKNAEIKILLAKFEEQQRDWKKFDEYLKQLKDVNKKLDSEIQRLTKEMALIENERGELKDRVKRSEAVTVMIKDKKYIASEVLKFTIDSSVVLNKLGIEGVLWRSGNICEDFVNEQILYDEAKKLNIIGDMKKHKDLAERYNLGREEGDYLYKYLTISDLIDRKVKEMPGERIVESLLLKYTQRDEYEKAVLATELQKDAKGGKSFEDVYKSYPDMVRLTLIRFQELEGWIKDRIQLLEDGEISDVVKTENDYMILKPLVKKPPYESRDEVRIFIKRWMDDLRQGEEIRIERTE